MNFLSTWEVMVMIPMVKALPHENTYLSYKHQHILGSFLVPCWSIISFLRLTTLPWSLLFLILVSLVIYITTLASISLVLDYLTCDSCSSLDYFCFLCPSWGTPLGCYLNPCYDSMPNSWSIMSIGTSISLFVRIYSCAPLVTSCSVREISSM